MPHHRNANIGHRSHMIDHNCAAFQLDCVSSSLQKPSCIAKRVFVAGLIRHEWHIADDERSLGSPSDKLRMVEHVVHRHRERIGLPLYDHTQRIPDQNRLDAGLFDNACKECVIGSDDNEFLLVALVLLKLGNRHHPTSALVIMSISRCVALMAII